MHGEHATGQGKLPGGEYSLSLVVTGWTKTSFPPEIIAFGHLEDRIQLRKDTQNPSSSQSCYPIATQARAGLMKDDCNGMGTIRGRFASAGTLPDVMLASYRAPCSPDC